MSPMLAAERLRREEEIFAAAPLLYRWLVEPCIDPDEKFSEEEKEYFRVHDIVPMPIKPRQTPLEAYGIECGDGWLKIIMEASLRIAIALEACRKV